MNPGVASVQIVQIRAFVAMCNVAMTVCAIQQEQLPALRCIGLSTPRIVSHLER
jgi:hypothetical protein